MDGGYELRSPVWNHEYSFEGVPISWFVSKTHHFVSGLTTEDPRDILYHILCGNHGEKLPFKLLLEALHFARIEKSDREGVEMLLLMCGIEMWRKLGH